jgi:Cys-tRNA(Pro)/Cys-tRNA(Cys) deacylase
MQVSPVASALTALGIPHVVFAHAGQVTSLEQAARERGQRPDQVVRTILFRLEADEFVMVLAAGPAQISWQRLRHYLGRSRITMASPEEVLHQTGYRVGTVGPLGLPKPVRILMDEGVQEQSQVSIGSGLPNTGVILSIAGLLEALPGAEIVDLTNDT